MADTRTLEWPPAEVSLLELLDMAAEMAERLAQRLDADEDFYSAVEAAAVARDVRFLHHEFSRLPRLVARTRRNEPGRVCTCETEGLCLTCR